MRRSLLLRLLALSLGVTALAVSATALLATYGTGDRLREELLATDNDILTALYTHANEHRDWTDVEPLVRELAERTGRRIALTTPDGVPIADSAENAALPTTPAARIDAADMSTSDIELTPNVVVREPTLRVGFSFYVWQLTEEERQQRQALVDEALDCVRRTGLKPEAERQRVQRPAGGGAPAIPCVPTGLLAPSAASHALEERAAAGIAACGDQPRCRDAVLAKEKRQYVAAPADLYLGESDRFDPFAPDGWWRTVTTAAAVLLAVVVVTMLAGRRLAAAFTMMVDSITSIDRQRRALVSDVAHELRTPLANVRSHLEAAQDGVLPLDHDLVGSLIEESALLERIVADLHDLALADAGMLRIHPEERDAADLAEQAVAAHRARAEACEVDLTVSRADPLTVYLDPARLRQALGNLVSNAIRHTPPGGTVTVTVTGEADAVVFTVSDNGSGIAEEHLPHIFDRFYRADPTAGGGLGLAITKHLVEAHGGHVTATSTPGEGATFTIRVPPRPPHGPPTRRRG